MTTTNYNLCGRMIRHKNKFNIFKQKRASVIARTFNATCRCTLCEEIKQTQLKYWDVHNTGNIVMVCMYVMFYLAINVDTCYVLYEIYSAMMNYSVL